MSEIGSHYDKLLWCDQRLACYTFGNPEISYNGVINMEVLNLKKQHTFKYTNTLNIIGYTNKTNIGLLYTPFYVRTFVHCRVRYRAQSVLYSLTLPYFNCRILYIAKQFPLHSLILLIAKSPISIFSFHA